MYKKLHKNDIKHKIVQCKNNNLPLLSYCYIFLIRVRGGVGVFSNTHQVRGSNIPWMGHQSTTCHSLTSRANLESPDNQSKCSYFFSAA